jgi:hypothetical protein
MEERNECKGMKGRSTDIIRLNEGTTVRSAIARKESISRWDGRYLWPAKISVDLAGRGNTQVDTSRLVTTTYPPGIHGGVIKQGLQAPSPLWVSSNPELKVNAPGIAIKRHAWPLVRYFLALAA